MARKANDGRGRLGGRQKGTPNRTTSDLKRWLSGLLDDNRKQFEDDIKALRPDERIRLLSGLMAYIIPKQQSLSVEEQAKVETEALTRWLETAPDEAVDAIAARVMELQAMNGDTSK